MQNQVQMQRTLQDNLEALRGPWLTLLPVGGWRLPNPQNPLDPTERTQSQHREAAHGLGPTGHRQARPDGDTARSPRGAARVLDSAGHEFHRMAAAYEVFGELSTDATPQNTHTHDRLATMHGISWKLLTDTAAPQGISDYIRVV